MALYIGNMPSETGARETQSSDVAYALYGGCDRYREHSSSCKQSDEVRLDSEVGLACLLTYCVAPPLQHGERMFPSNIRNTYQLPWSTINSSNRPNLRAGSVVLQKRPGFSTPLSVPFRNAATTYQLRSSGSAVRRTSEASQTISGCISKQARRIYGRHALRCRRKVECSRLANTHLGLHARGWVGIPGGARRLQAIAIERTRVYRTLLTLARASWAIILVEGACSNWNYHRQI